MYITQWIIKRTLGTDVLSEARKKQRLGMLEGSISAGFSLVLSLVKVVFGFMSGSISLMADAANNFSDLGSSLVIAFSFHLSKKPKDAKHPYGHGRMECIAGLVLSLLLIVVGIEVARAGISRLLHPEPLTATPLIMTVVVITILAKTWLALFARTLAHMCDSTVLWADAWNHTYDIACTALVLLALWGARHGYPAIDGWAGLSVSLFIIYTGCRFGLETISNLLGEAPTREEVERIKQRAGAQQGVMGVHDVMIHKYGDVHVVSLHIEVDAKKPVMDIHALSEQVEALIEEDLSVSKVIVHTDPIDRDFEEYNALEALLKDHVSKHPAILDFHDLRLSDEPEGLNLSVDLVLKSDTPPASHEDIQTALEKQVRDHTPRLRQITICLESSYEDPV
ncbi:MAG: cation transporter [Spartobacteria bacterium]|nr:cation transporter [Spartobacteria bacterium]